jgi:hypothetical protein
MADRLSVDLAALDTLGTTLESIRAQLNATRTVLDSFRGELGSADVENALGDFEEGWKDGRKKIDGNAKALAAMATESARALRQVDGDLRDRLIESSQPESSSSTTVGRAV